MIIRFLKKVRALLFHRRQLEQDLEDELLFHLQMKSEAVRGGSAEARRSFGNPTAFEEVLRDMWTFASLESWWKDLRYAVRSLAAAPGFSVVAIAAIGLGIGADTAMFTIIKGAFSWDLGLDHVDRIVSILTADAATHASDLGSSYPDFRDFRNQAKSLEGIAAYQFEPANVSDSKRLPERFWCARISSNGFRVSEQKPVLGRDFVDSDEAPGATPVVVLSHRVWLERYGQDPAILGKVVRVDEIPRVIIAVMPPNRRFPEDTDLWTPLPASEKRDDRRLMMFARVPANGNLATVRAEADTISRSLAAQYPGTNKGLSASIRPIAEITGAYAIRPVFAILFTAVGFVLLIACADVANMLLARGVGRTREMSIRVAIGAGKARILRQLLIESVVLSAAGGVLGGFLAVGGLRWFDAGTAALAAKPSWMHLTLDREAFWYLAGISIFTGILFGLAPALRLAGTSVQAAMKDGGHGTTGGGRVSMRLANGLVVFQMILCIVLLAGAGLMIRSASKLYTTPIGVNPANVLTARVNLPTAKYREPADLIEFQRSAKAKLEALPGVGSEAAASNPPLGRWETFDGELQSDAVARRIDGIVATSNYFPLFEVKPALGRIFTDDEAAVVVNESFAAKYWTNEVPIGKHLRLLKDHAPQEWLTVTGVIPDILQDARNQLSRHALVYLPFAQLPQRQMVILARTRVPPSTLAQAARAEIQKIDQNLPLYEVRPLENRIDEGRLSTKLFGAMCTVFAGIALALAAIGLYAVIAHSVSMRSQEIGLRMAMGGTGADILRLVFTQGMRPLLIGLLIGVPLALLAMRALTSALAGVSPGDPLTFVLVVLVLAVAGALGCAIPAIRATRVDPAVALRTD
jgi:putative ABC transport system permease protein